MATRCVACDKPFLSLPDHPFLANQTDDICSYCKAMGNSLYNYTEDHEFILDNARQGVTETKDMSNY